MKKDTYWFPHDYNAKDDPKCVLLIDQLGLEGYGIFWVLIETLREQPGYKYPLNLLPALARRYNTTAEKVNTVVKSYELFQMDNDNIFFSKSLTERLIPFEEKKAQAREAALKRWENYERNANALQSHNERNADAMLIRVEESRVKEKRIEKNINISNEISGENPGIDSFSDDFESFIVEFNQIRGSQFQKTDKVKKQFNARLKEGFIPAQMLQALKNGMKDKYHISEGYKYLTPEFFTRSDKIEKFLNVPEAKASSVTPEKLGVDEWIRPDGTRTYGTGKITIPMNAPPRPSGQYAWNESTQQWINL